MLSSGRRRGRAGAVTPVVNRYGRRGAAIRAAKTVYGAAKKLAPYARAAGAKSTLGRKIGQGWRKPRRYASGPRTITESEVKVGAESATGNELSTFTRNVGRFPRLTNNRLLKMMKAGMGEVILRAQGMTNQDTNVGFYPLANRQQVSGEVAVPLHVWDITTIPNYTVTGDQPVHVPYWASTAASSDLGRLYFRVQDAAGAGSAGAGGSQYYVPEKVTGNLSLGTGSRVTHAMHEWTQAKLLLYGARKRGTTFYIDFARVTNDYASLLNAAGSNKPFKDLVRYLTAPLTYSSIQTFKPEVRRYIKIVKSFKFYVPGGSADDLDTIGKVKQVNLFLKQGNVYSLNWNDSGNTEALSHAQADGDAFQNSAKFDDHPVDGSRLVMIIRAFSPERRTCSIFDDADPLTEPSYDIVLRNKWTVPS